MVVTIAEKLATVLLRRGYKEIESKTRKYRTFVSNKQDERKLFVGKSGALRVGQNSSTSVSITNGRLYKVLIAEFDNPPSTT